MQTVHTEPLPQPKLSMQLNVAPLLCVCLLSCVEAIHVGFIFKSSLPDQHRRDITFIFEDQPKTVPLAPYQFELVQNFKDPLLTNLAAVEICARNGSCKRYGRDKLHSRTRADMVSPGPAQLVYEIS
jgi:hypothetical protein